MKNGRTSQERLERKLQARVRTKDVRKQLEYESRWWFEWVHDLVWSYESDFAGRFRAWLDVHGSTFREILNLSLFNRLRRLYQWGVKHYVCAHEGDPWNPENLWASLPLAHSRWMHSVQVSAKATVLGLRAGCTDAEVLHLAVAGLCHDLGHPAGSHDADLLMMREGLPGHEAYGIKLVAESPEFERILGAGDVQKVLRVMAEEGPLGHIQSLADTWTYAGGHDMRMAYVGREVGLRKRLEGVFDTVDYDLFAVVSRVDERGPNVARTEPFEQLLGLRMWLGSRYYFSLPNTLAQSAFQKVLLAARDAGILQLPDLSTMTDPMLYGKLSSWMNEDPELPDPLASMIRIVLRDTAEFDRWTAEVHQDGDPVGAHQLLAKPRPHWPKVIPVVYQGSVIRLEAGPLVAGDTSWVYTFVG